MRVQARGDIVTLSITPDTARQLTRLLHVLVGGEGIATTCAHWQAQVANNPRSRRFFRSQARQEDFHAQLFAAAAHFFLRQKFPLRRARLSALTAIVDA